MIPLVGHGQTVKESSTPAGAVKGIITRAENERPLADVTITLTDTLNFKSDSSGVFFINNLAPGKYVLHFSHVGYQTEPFEIAVTAGDTLPLNVIMRETPVNVDDITIFSKRQNALSELSTPHNSIEREDLAESPKIGEDIYRAVTRVPGVSSNDFSATFKVRGGEHNQVLVLLDGLELYEPFHIKDVDGGILSIIDMDIVESIDLSTGAFSAAYGNHLSGVFNIKTKQPEEDNRKFSVSIDFLNARVLTSGTFSDNKGSWLASARRGYFEMITKLTDDYEDISPAFYDFFIKGGIEPGPNHSLTVNFLHAHDDFDFVDDDEDTDFSKSLYDNTYTWLTLSSSLWEKLLIRNTISSGIVKHNRRGVNFYENTENLYFKVKDFRKFRFYGFNQSHIFCVSNFYSLYTGINLNFLKTEYNYFSDQENRYEDIPHRYIYFYDTLEYINVIDGHTSGVYLSNQVKLTSTLKTELGLRYDHFSYIDKDCFSPRINVTYDVGKNISLHGGWGYFYQPQKLYELAIPDGDSSFYKAEKAEHFVIGIETTVNDNILFFLEGYYKKIADLRPDYRNLILRTELYPEANFDRIKLLFDNSKSKGLEMSVKNSPKNRFHWKVGYTLSYVEEKLVEYTLDGNDIPVNETLPGEFDQRHALFIDLSYRPSADWKFSLAWEYHSGWPYTEMVNDDYHQLFLINHKFEEVYAERMPTYHRMDIRINRTFNTSHGRVYIFLDIINLYDHDNIFTYDYEEAYNYNGYYYEKDPLYYLHFIPSLGVSWVWEF